MQIRYKLWFESEKGYIFGKGAYELLKKVDELGSIRKASIEMGISYRHAWGLIREIEENLGIAVVNSVRGGSAGGKTMLTAEGKKLIERYERYMNVFEYVKEHPYIKPSLTVDMLLVESGKILLIKRKREPFKGLYALPGGFVEHGEKTEEAAKREMLEETGLKVEIERLIGVYSDPHRDPRDHTVTIVYKVRKIDGMLEGGDDASEAKFFPISALPKLAFDHREIIEDYLKQES